MTFWGCVAKAIGLIWRFVTSVFLITLVSFILFFILLVLLPENTLQALEVVEGLFT